MEFRPCIDIHNGKVKQIVGGSLLDEGNRAKENFVAEQDAAFFAKLYREQGLKGGHIILLNPRKDRSCLSSSGDVGQSLQQAKMYHHLSSVRIKL